MEPEEQGFPSEHILLLHRTRTQQRVVVLLEGGPSPQSQVDGFSSIYLPINSDQLPAKEKYRHTMMTFFLQLFHKGQICEVHGWLFSKNLWGKETEQLQEKSHTSGLR
ncbi:hypothetical protein AMECASPLE_015293 [Ameca splendens]|uniref:Uncharacterized protein n=1 Tax=Ameca splendens TaxID=208324 RepID=A0ABV0YD52_9TELE